jgi:hypothetical protein
MNLAVFCELLAILPLFFIAKFTGGVAIHAGLAEFVRKSVSRSDENRGGARHSGFSLVARIHRVLFANHRSAFATLPHGQTPFAQSLRSVFLGACSTCSPGSIRKFAHTTAE